MSTHNIFKNEIRKKYLLLRIWNKLILRTAEWLAGSYSEKKLEPIFPIVIVSWLIGIPIIFFVTYHNLIQYGYLVTAFASILVCVCGYILFLHCILSLVMTESYREDIEIG